MPVSITKPTVGGSTGIWGQQLNDNLDAIIAAINANTEAVVGKATPADIQAAVASLVNGAPGILDTLGEIAAQLAADESAATALATAVNARYTKPSGGIPASDLAAAVQALLGVDQTARDAAANAVTTAANDATGKASAARAGAVSDVTAARVAQQPHTLATFLDTLSSRVTPVAVWDASTVTGAQGDVIGAIEDQAGQGLAAFATGANRPTLQAAALNGLNTLRFSATQYLVTAAGITQWDMPFRAQPLTLYALVKLRSAGSSSAIRSIVTSTGTSAICGIGVAATVNSATGYASWPYPVGGSAATSGGDGINDDTWHLVIVRMNAQGNTTIVDGVVVGANITATQGTQPLAGRIALAAYNTAGGLPMDGDLAEVGILQGEISLKGCERLTDYIRAKWNYGSTSTPKQDTVLIEDRVDAGSQSYRMLRTVKLSNATPPLLVMNHHQGGVIANMQPGGLGSGNPYTLARAAALAGWVVLWPLNHSDSWTSTAGLSDGPNAEANARLALGVTGFSAVVLFGMSMGGALATVQAKAAAFTAPVKGVYLIDPAVNVKYAYTTSGYKASIDTAMGIVASTLSSAAAAGDSTIQTPGTMTVGAQIVIDPTGANPEYRTVTAATGSAPTTLTLNTPLSFAHASGAAVTDFPTKVTNLNRDPCAWAPSYVPSGLRWRLGASANDTTIVKAQFADVFAGILASASTVELSQFTHPGGHLEVSTYRPADLVSFLTRCLT